METFRGKGIYQTAVDSAIDKLKKGAWVCSCYTLLDRVLWIHAQVHLFGEGQVVQTNEYIEIEGAARLQRFKWGMYVWRLSTILLYVHST